MRDSNEIFIDGISLKRILEDHKKWVRNEKGGKKAVLRGKDLSQVDFGIFASLSMIDFSGANLEGADFGWSALEGADFSEANLEGAEFNCADLTDADLRNCIIDGACLDFTIIRDTKF